MKSTSAPSVSNGSGNGEQPVTCPSCNQTGIPRGRGQCRHCGQFLPGNEAALRHGLRRYRDRGELPEDLQQTIDEFFETLISDQGGHTEQTAIRGSLIRQLKDLEVARRLLLKEIIERGPATGSGAKAMSLWLSVLDRWHRTATTLGLERREKQVPSLREALDSIPVEESR